MRALEERLNRQPTPVAVPQDDVTKRADRERRKAEIMAILARIDKLPILDNRTPDEIIGYNEYGAFD